MLSDIQMVGGEKAWRSIQRNYELGLVMASITPVHFLLARTQSHGHT